MTKHQLVTVEGKNMKIRLTICIRFKYIIKEKIKTPRNNEETILSQRYISSVK